MFDYTNLCEVNFKTRRTTYCSNIVLYSMNMFYTLYSIYNMYVQFIEISSWEVVTYGIYARVNLFSQNERASATSE